MAPRPPCGPVRLTAVRDLGADLTGLLRREWDDADLTVSGLQRLTGGASRETWSFDALRGDGRRLLLILRRDPPGTERPGGMSGEAAALRAAARAGVPEPRIYVNSEDSAVLGAPFIIMERLPGETIARRILREERYARAREVLAYQCGEVLARIHSIAASEVGGLSAADPLARCEEDLLALDEPHPVLELGLRWLKVNRPPASGPPAVVHGDFRNGNLIIGEEGIRGVLDWEVVHLGDPAEDLGWMCVKAWRFGAGPPVGGFGSYDQLLEGYRAGGGRPLEVDTVKWWEALGTLRWGLGCIGQARRHLDGGVRSVELAAIGRRACEQEWDLLGLIR